MPQKTALAHNSLFYIIDKYCTSVKPFCNKIYFLLIYIIYCANSCKTFATKSIFAPPCRKGQCLPNCQHFCKKFAIRCAFANAQQATSTKLPAVCRGTPPLANTHCIAIDKKKPNAHTKRFATCPTRQRKSKLLNQCDVLSQQSFKSAFSPYTGACFCVQHTFACLAQTCHKQTATKACHLLAKHAHLPTTWWQKHKKKALPCGKAFFL